MQKQNTKRIQPITLYGKITHEKINYENNNKNQLQYKQYFKTTKKT